jgi:hypothetical protein
MKKPVKTKIHPKSKLYSSGLLAHTTSIEIAAFGGGFLLVFSAGGS